MMSKSLIIIKNMTISPEDYSSIDFSDVIDLQAAPVPMQPPGRILYEEFLQPMGITAYRLAKSIGVSRRTIGQILSGHRSITVDTGLRLSHFFGLSDGYFTRLQLDYDIEQSKQSLASVLPTIVPFDSSGIQKVI